MSTDAVPEIVIEAGHSESNYWRDLSGATSNFIVLRGVTHASQPDHE